LDTVDKVDSGSASIMVINYVYLYICFVRNCLLTSTWTIGWQDVLTIGLYLHMKGCARAQINRFPDIDTFQLSGDILYDLSIKLEQKRH